MQTKRVVDRSERLTLTGFIEVPETWRLFLMHTHTYTQTPTVWNYPFIFVFTR